MTCSGLFGFIIGVLLGYVAMRVRRCHHHNYPHAILMERAEGAEEREEMQTTITAGAKKLVRFAPKNKFGKPSKWDADNPLHVLSSTGTATLTPVDVDYAGEPFPADQAGQWFSLGSNGIQGPSAFDLVGDGHDEVPGEEEVLKAFNIHLDVQCVAADVESADFEEGPEVAE